MLNFENIIKQRNERIKIIKMYMSTEVNDMLRKEGKNYTVELRAQLCVTELGLQFADGWGASISDTVSRNLFARAIDEAHALAKPKGYDSQLPVDICALVNDLDKMAGLPVFEVPTYAQRLKSGAFSPRTTVEDIKRMDDGKDYPSFYLDLQLQRVTPEMHEWAQRKLKSLACNSTPLDDAYRRAAQRLSIKFSNAA